MRTLLIVMIVLMPSAIYGATLHVPADYSTIQAAIDAASNGDTVLVAPGTYVERITFLGKAITVKSSDGRDASSTVIDGNQWGTVVTFDGGELANTVLEGVTITNGWTADEGGGIFCDHSSPTLNNLIISNNEAVLHGGGVSLIESDTILTGCQFKNNHSEKGYGGGLRNSNSGASYPKLIHCVFDENSASEGRGGGAFLGGNGGSFNVMGCVFSRNSCGFGFRGGAIAASGSNLLIVTNSMFFENTADTLGGALYFFCQTTPVVTNCTFYSNSAYSGGAIYNYGCDTVITNCILWDNEPDEIYNYNFADPVVTYCDVKGGYTGTGNIDEDPLFVDSTNGDLHLTYPSPCKDKGINAHAADVQDFEGDPRIAYGNVDMGGDEFYTHLYCTGDFTPNGNIEGKLVGLPSAWPVGLFIGSGIMDPPMQHMWGNFYLEAPWMLLVLMPISANGVLIIPTTIPATPAAPYDIPMQALIDYELTNLFVLQVR